jgi:hypothetical protein
VLLSLTTSQKFSGGTAAGEAHLDAAIDMLDGVTGQRT